MMETPFQKLPKSLLETRKNHGLFEAVARGIRLQVEDPPYAVNMLQLAQIPYPAQAVYWLWRFQCEAGVCGIDVFVLNRLGVYSPQVHSALKAVDAIALALLLEKAVALARDESAEFRQLPDQSWFEQFSRTTDFSDLHLLNKPVFSLMDALSDLVAAYIRANEADIFEN
jgi:hypothetical protein